MANRYNTTRKAVTKKYSNETTHKKKHRYQTTIYNKVPEKNSDMYFVATKGDRCDILADRFYGDSKLWWFIARVNHLNTMHIPAGISLRIPLTTREANGS